MVLIAVAQQWIVRGYLVKKVKSAFRQIDVIDVYQVEIVASRVVAVYPFVFPCCAGYYSGVFRPFLIIE